MKKNRVIKPNNLPPKVPITGILVWILLLDRLNAPDWLWGVAGTVFGLLLIIAIISVFNCEYVDLLKDE